MDQQKRELRRWILSSIDVDQAVKWADYIRSNQLYKETTEEARQLSRALQTAMIVAYARPFSRNHDTNDTIGKLPSAFLDGYTREEKLFHKRVLHLRNKVYAHSDSDVRDLRVRITDFLGEPAAWPTSHNLYVSMEEAEIERFRVMARKLLSSITDAIIRAQRQLEPGDIF